MQPLPAGTRDPTLLVPPFSPPWPTAWYVRTSIAPYSTQLVVTEGIPPTFEDYGRRILSSLGWRDNMATLHLGPLPVATRVLHTMCAWMFARLEGHPCVCPGIVVHRALAKLRPQRGPALDRHWPGISASWVRLAAWWRIIAQGIFDYAMLGVEFVVQKNKMVCITRTQAAAALATEEPGRMTGDVAVVSVPATVYGIAWGIESMKEVYYDNSTAHRAWEESGSGYSDLVDHFQELRRPLLPPPRSCPGSMLKALLDGSWMAVPDVVQELLSVIDPQNDLIQYVAREYNLSYDEPRRTAQLWRRVLAYLLMPLELELVSSGDTVSVVDLPLERQPVSRKLRSELTAVAMMYSRVVAEANPSEETAPSLGQLARFSYQPCTPAPTPEVSFSLPEGLSDEALAAALTLAAPRLGSWSSAAEARIFQKCKISPRETARGWCCFAAWPPQDALTEWMWMLVHAKHMRQCALYVIGAQMDARAMGTQIPAAALDTACIAILTYVGPYVRFGSRVYAYVDNKVVPRGQLAPADVKQQLWASFAEHGVPDHLVDAARALGDDVCAAFLGEWPTSGPLALPVEPGLSPEQLLAACRAMRRETHTSRLAGRCGLRGIVVSVERRRAIVASPDWIGLDGEMVARSSCGHIIVHDRDGRLTAGEVVSTTIAGRVSYKDGVHLTC